MILPIYSLRGQRKPYSSIPRIDWSHPLARGLMFYAYDMGGFHVDLVGGSCSTPTIGKPDRGNSVMGAGSSYINGGPASAFLLTDRCNGTLTAPFSFGCGLFPTGTPTSGATIFSLGDAGSSPDGIYIQSSTSIRFGWANAAGDTITIANYTNAYHSALGVATSSTACIDYYDGKQIGTNAVGGNFTQTTAQFMFNAFDPGTLVNEGYIGFVYYGAYWKDRALTAADAAQLHADPYCFLIYPEDEIFAMLLYAAAIDTLQGPQQLVMM